MMIFGADGFVQNPLQAAMVSSLWGVLLWTMDEFVRQQIGFGVD